MGFLTGQWMATLISGWDRLRESYWFLPTLMAAAAACLALALIEFDQQLTERAARRLPWIQDAGAEGTRAVLSVIAGSMITVTGVVFSITIVALTLASSQFGPRLLRNFLRDRGNQLVLGTFVATFLYSLLVLRAVEADRVPHVAATVALALATTSLFVLIYFVHHAASSIQASSIIASVAREIDGEIDMLFPERLGSEVGADDRDRSRIDGFCEEARPLPAVGHGYLRVIDAESILGCAAEHDLQICLETRPGDFVTEGDRLARVGPAERVPEEVIARLQESFVVGDRPSGVQDLAFLTDQLVEMAVRALSPGINDPGTAIACLHRLGSVVNRVAGRRMPSSQRFDESGTLRVVAQRTPSFAGVVASCFDPIRRYGVADAAVIVELLAVMEGALPQCAADDRRSVLLDYAREVHREFLETPRASKRDRAIVDTALGRVERAAAVR